MDFTLTFKDTEEHGWPSHLSKISYYVLKDNPYLEQKLHPQYGEVTYAWFSACYEVNEYYNPETESSFKLGDSRPSTHFSDDENESHRTVYLMVCLGGYAHNLNNNPELPRIAWQYTHDFQRVLSQYQGKNYFPCFDINNLLREGIVRVNSYVKVLIDEGEDSDQNYFQVYANVTYKEEKYHIRMSQDCAWEDDEWEGDVEHLKFGKVSIYQWNKIKEKPNDK